MNISFDIHGVIDTDPEYFSKLTKEIKEAGHKVYICTGASTVIVEPDLKQWNIYYDKILSVVDLHSFLGTKMWVSEQGSPMMKDEVWNKSKAYLCDLVEMDIHFDDSYSYGYYFKTPYLDVTKFKNTSPVQVIESMRKFLCYHTIPEWEQIEEIKILDPDGFDRNNLYLYTELFSRIEFLQGVNRSTCEMKIKERYEN